MGAIFLITTMPIFLIENVQTQSGFIRGVDQVCFVGDTYALNIELLQ